MKIGKCFIMVVFGLYIMWFFFIRYDLLIAHKEVLALLITLEQGKPLKEALGEVSHWLALFKSVNHHICLHGWCKELIIENW